MFSVACLEGMSCGKTLWTNK